MAEATSGMVASGEKVSVGVGVCIDRVFDREREYHRSRLVPHCTIVSMEMQTSEQ